jgi:cyanophycinase
MKKVVLVLLIIVTIIVDPIINPTARSQDVSLAPRLFVGGGALPEAMYAEFIQLTGLDAKLVVIPTASSRDVEIEKIKDQWRSRGLKEISVMHTIDRNVASSAEFIEPLRTATAVWFSGGSQQRIADAYLGTPVEDELYELLKRGGVIGGSSAGAAILSSVMISSGNDPPKITTGLRLLPNAIIDQHFLKRNRLARLIAAIRSHPDLIGLGIDEGTAIIVSNKEYKVVGDSYVLRIELIDGSLKIDAFEDGDIIPMADH